MKKTFAILSLSALIILISACSYNNFNFKKLALFNPANEYFIADLTNLHYLIETLPINKLKEVYPKYSKGCKFPETTQGYSDGKYYGESPEDAFGYKHVIKFEIKEGKFTNIFYDEIKEGKKSKRFSEEYCKKMAPCGTDPSKAYPKLEEELIAKQNIASVDGVSGATYSTYRFRYAASMALMHASIHTKK